MPSSSDVVRPIAPSSTNISKSTLGSLVPLIANQPGLCVPCNCGLMVGGIISSIDAVSVTESCAVTNGVSVMNGTLVSDSVSVITSLS